MLRSGAVMVRLSRVQKWFFLAAIAVAAGIAPALLAQTKVEHKVDPLALPLDKPDVWTLHFRYKAPRIVTLDTLDKNGKPAKKVVWYMWYQVYKTAGDPETFLPEFELVTKDLNTTHLDQPEPDLVQKIAKIEDPTGELHIKTNIDISKQPVPVTPPDSFPRYVSGIAVWTDMNERAPKTNKFSVYVTGLSNGLAVEELPNKQRLIKRKTLQINFVRPTDDNRPQAQDIVPDDLNGPAEKWIYRTVSTLKPKQP